MSTCHSTARWALALFCALAIGAHLQAAQATLSASVTKTVIESDKKQTVFLKVGLTGFAMEAEHKRAGVNVALVIDRSGSMVGEKMERAKEAAIVAVDRLNADDIVSVIVFDHTVEVLVPSTKLTDKEAVRKAIRTITARGQTALFAGVSKGAEEVRKFKQRDRLNRVILLTDGQANVGPSSPSDLGYLGESLRKEGISVSTMGLGSDYNEDLLAKLASKSEGSHSFIEKASDIARLFNLEFDDVLSICAQEAVIKIECSPGVRPVRVLNRDNDMDGRTVTVPLSQLFAGQEKFMVLEVEIAPGKDGESRQIAKVTGTYANMSTKAADQLTSTVSIAFSSSKEKADKSDNREAMIAAVEQIALEKNKLATQMRDEGKIVEASKVFAENAAVLNRFGDKYSSQNLRDHAGYNSRAQLNVAPGLWEAERKNLINNQDVYQNQARPPEASEVPRPPRAR